MAKRFRVLIIDSEHGEEMVTAIREGCTRDDVRVQVALAQHHAQVQRLLWSNGKTWKGGVKKRPRRFNVAVVNANSDLRKSSCEPEGGWPGPLGPAFTLEGERKVPVLIYSPVYTGLRLQSLQDMVAGAFSGVFEQSAIPEAVQLYLREPQKADAFTALLEIMRSMGDRAREAHKKLLALVETMSEQTREACMRILAQEASVKFGFA